MAGPVSTQQVSEVTIRPKSLNLQDILHFYKLDGQERNAVGRHFVLCPVYSMRWSITKAIQLLGNNSLFFPSR